MSRGKKIIKSSVWRNITFFSRVGISFYMMPFLIHALNEQNYGIWTIAGTFVGYFGMLDLGLSSAVSRYVSRAVGQNDDEEVIHVVNTSFFLFVGLGFIVTILTISATFLLPHLINDPSELKLLGSIILILGLNLAISFPVRALNGIIGSHFRHDTIAKKDLCELIFSSALIYTFISNGYGIISIVLISAIFSQLGSLWIVYMAFKLQPNLKISFKLQRSEIRKKLWGYSLYTFLAQIADILRFKVDQLVIAGFIGLGAVTHYFVGQRFVEYFSEIILKTMGASAPIYSQEEGKGDFESLNDKFFKLSKICGYLSLYIGFSIILFGEAFISRWMGVGFEDSYSILVILVGAMMVALMQSPAVGLLYGLSKHKFYAWANSIEGLFNLALSLILVRYYGIIGVALGTAIPSIIIKFILQPIYVSNVTEIKYNKLIRLYLEVIIKTSFFISCSYFLLLDNFLAPKYLNILILGFLQTLIFIPFCWFIGFFVGSSVFRNKRNYIFLKNF